MGEGKGEKKLQRGKEANHKRPLQTENRGTWVAQSVERLTSAQVMILQFVSSSPASGSVLMAQSLESASDSVSPSLSLAPSPVHACEQGRDRERETQNLKQAPGSELLSTEPDAGFQLTNCEIMT